MYLTPIRFPHWGMYLAQIRLPHQGVSRTTQIAALGYVSHTNHIIAFGYLAPITQGYFFFAHDVMESGGCAQRMTLTRNFELN